MALSIISYRINIGILSIYTALGCILGVQMSAFEFEGPFWIEFFSTGGVIMRLSTLRITRSS